MQDSNRTLTMTKDDLERLICELDGMALSKFWSLNLTSSDIETVSVSNADQERWVTEIREVMKGDVRVKNHGLIVIWSDPVKLLINPPKFFSENVSEGSFELHAMKDIFKRQLTIGVVLLRLGYYAVGIFRGDKLAVSKSGSRYVHGRHKKGGSSQARFQRIRNKQAFEIYKKTCDITRGQFVPYERDIDHIFLGGESHVLGGFIDVCPYLHKHKRIIADKILEIRRPGQKALEGILRKIWTSRVVLYKWPHELTVQQVVNRSAVP